MKEAASSIAVFGFLGVLGAFFTKAAFRARKGRRSISNHLDRISVVSK